MAEPVAWASVPSGSGGVGAAVETRSVVVRGLTKSFGDKVAVAGISLDVPRGSFYGLVGPNGAGKSTTIKMLTGILVPTSGELVVAGLNPQERRTDLARRIGVVFGQRSALWWDLPLRDSFTLLQKIYRVAPAGSTARPSARPCSAL